MARAERVDVVVVGCGGAGAAAAWRLAQRGRHVAAIEQFEPAHRRGSSHGTDRIVRAAYADVTYARLAVAAVEQWRELEVDAGHLVLTVTGGIDFGDANEIGAVAAGLAAVGVATEWLDSTEARRRFPGIAVDGPVLHQPSTGTVNADRSVAAMQRMAEERGADIAFGERVQSIEDAGDRVDVRTDRRRISADTCVVTAGAWSTRVLGDLVSLPAIAVTQEQVAYFQVRSGFGVETWPTFIDREQPTVYGMRTPDGLVKAAEHCTGPLVDPDDRSFALEPETWARLLDWVRRHLPGVDPHPVTQTTCLYASSPTDDFVIDRVGRIVVAKAGLGGHGFKFLPEIGRRLADLADGLDLADNPFALRGAGLDEGRSARK